MRIREVHYLDPSTAPYSFSTGVPNELVKKECFAQNTAITSEMYAFQDNSSLLCELQTLNPKK